MNIATKTLIAGGLMAAAMSASPAFAVPIGLSESYGTSGGAGADYAPHTGSGSAGTLTPSLFSATSVNSGTGYTINGASGPAGVNGDLLYFTNQNLSLSQTTCYSSSLCVGTVNFGSPPSYFGVAWDNTLGFASTSANYTATASNNGASITILFSGVFTDTSNTYATQAASFTEIYSQSGGSSISFGANFSTAPAPVPEPISMGILGLGLLGLAAVKMRRA